MSLDVYLKSDHAWHQEEPKIYIRENGKTVEISQHEWEARCEERGIACEPVMSPPSENNIVYHANITHNLGKMAAAVNLFQHLWRPEELGITKASQLIEPLREGLFNLVSQRHDLEKYNPENGWGNYDGLVEFTRNYLKACEENPDSEVEVSR